MSMSFNSNTSFLHSVTNLPKYEACITKLRMTWTTTTLSVSISHFIPGYFLTQLKAYLIPIITIIFRDISPCEQRDKALINSPLWLRATTAKL